jgi:hypothetical protein
LNRKTVERIGNLAFAALRYPEPTDRLTIEQHNVIAGVWEHLRIRGCLGLKLHSDEKFSLGSGDRRLSKLGRADSRIQVVEKYFVQRLGGTDGESRHGSKVRGASHSTGP